MATATRSILRYPGSKARFVPFIEETIRLNKYKFDVFCEPFCGGASVSISLLERGIVDTIALNDADPLVSSLWDTVFSPIYGEWLADQVKKIPFSLAEWDYQKSLIPTSPREAALKCLFLNRTSFNGILYHSGPVGGRNQEKRTLDARFNREKIADRIIELSKLSDRVVSVSNNDWKSFSDRINKKYLAFFYFDPPYYHKAETLYGYYFVSEDHIKLNKYLAGFPAKWILSYDDVPEIRDIYRCYKNRTRVIDNTYSAHPIGGTSRVGRELFFTNLLELPCPGFKDGKHIAISVKETNPIDSNSENKQEYRIAYSRSAHMLVNDKGVAL